MTIKEMAEIAGVSAETIRAKGKELYPDRIINGIKTVFTREQAVKIMAEIRVKGAMIPTENLSQNLQVHRQDADVVTKADMAAFGASIVQEMMKQFLPLIQNRQPTMIEQDYYSINGYANKIGQRIAFSDALSIGRMAGKLSREEGVEIRKVDDERYGHVNSYHIDILKEVFTV